MEVGHNFVRTHDTAVRAVILFCCGTAVVLALIPWYADYLQSKSLKQAELGFQADALSTAQTAVTLNPLSIRGRFVLAGAWQRLGQEQEARDTLQQATGIQPRNYTVWEQLAVYERDRWGEPELARENFEIAMNLNPLDKQLRARAGLPPES